MQAIYKFKLDGPVTPITLPQGSKVLDLEWRNGDIYLWALCNPAKEPMTRKFRVHETGSEYPFDTLKFRKTVHSPSRAFHVFEVT
jgi:hypothetical protein